MQHLVGGGVKDERKYNRKADIAETERILQASLS